MTIRFKDNSEEIRRKIRQVSGPQTVPMPELFDPVFMAKYTKFSSCEQMFEHALNGNGVAHPNDLTRDQMDAMAVSHTNFSNWNEMMGTAHAEWLKRKLSN